MQPQESKLVLLKEQKQAAQKELSALSKTNAQLIASFRQLAADARQPRRERDSLNEKAGQLRKLRNELFADVKKKQAELKQLSGELGALRKQAQFPAPALQELIEKLEWQLQTEAISPRGEKELSKRISDLRAQLPFAQKAQELLQQERKLKNEIALLFQRLSQLRLELAAVAKEADEKHSALVKLYEKGDGLRKRIGEGVQAVGEKRDSLEQASKEFFGELSELKRQEELEAKEREEKALAEKQKLLQKTREKANEIREKMKSGGKITTEELLLLQELEQ